MRALCCALSFSFLAACATTKPAPEPFKLAPAPEGTLTVAMPASTATMEQQAQVFADFVKQATGKPTRPAVFPDYESLADALAAGTVDVAFVPPLLYVRARAKAQVQPLLALRRNGQITYRSVLFARADRPTKALGDLSKGDLKAAWVDPSSASGYIFPKALLLQSKINPAGVFVAQDFFGTHEQLCQAVLDGKADVGATFCDDTAAEPASVPTGCLPVLGENKAALAVIGATQNIPNDTLVARVDLPEAEKQAIVAAAQALETSEEGKKTLVDAVRGEGFAPVTEAEFEPVHAALDVFKE